MERNPLSEGRREEGRGGAQICGKFYEWDTVGCMGETPTPVWVRYRHLYGWDTSTVVWSNTSRAWLSGNIQIDDKAQKTAHTENTEMFFNHGFSRFSRFISTTTNFTNFTKWESLGGSWETIRTGLSPRKPKIRLIRIIRGQENLFNLHQSVVKN